MESISSDADLVLFFLNKKKKKKILGPGRLAMF